MLKIAYHGKPADCFEVIPPPLALPPPTTQPELLKLSLPVAFDDALDDFDPPNKPITRPFSW